MTWIQDLITIAKAWRWGRPKRLPHGVPPKTRTHYSGRHKAISNPLRKLMSRGFQIDLLGLDSVDGLNAPVVIAANHQNTLDQRVLKSALPLHWWISTKQPEAALAAGRSVIVFPEGEPSTDGRLRVFDDRASELAYLHDVPLVPVAISGTFNLKALLSLRGMKSRPLVRLRIGTPIYPRRSSIREATMTLRAAIRELQAEETESWWQAQLRQGSSEPLYEKMASWRQIWAQSSPRKRVHHSKRIWYRDS